MLHVLLCRSRAAGHRVVQVAPDGRRTPVLRAAPLAGAAGVALLGTALTVRGALGLLA